MNKQRWLDIAEVIDALRIVPRLMLIVYTALLIYTSFWFFGLEDPNAPQASFADFVWGAAAVFTGWYASTGRKWR